MVETTGGKLAEVKRFQINPKALETEYINKD